MNPRIYKKLSKRAEDYIRRLSNINSIHGAGLFCGTDDEDELPARGLHMDAPLDWHGYFVPLHNTRLVSYKTSYEYDEWDSLPTLDWLSDMMYWTFVDITYPGPNAEKDIQMVLPISLKTWRDVFAAAERALAGDIPKQYKE